MVMLDVQQTGQSGVDNPMLLNMRRLHTVSRESLMAGGGMLYETLGAKRRKGSYLTFWKWPKGT